MSRQQSIWTFSFGAACFGFTPIFSKYGFFAGHSLGQIIAAQMIIATSALWILTFCRKSDWTHVTKSSALKLTVSGMLSGSTAILYYASLQYLPTPISIILIFQFVWIGILYEWIFDRKKPTKLTMLSLVLTLLGVAFAANFIGGNTADMSVKGLIYGILSAFTYAGFIYVNGKVATDVDPIIRTSFMLTGSLILAIVIFPTMFVTTEMIKSSVWVYSVGTALFGSIIPPLLFSISAPYLPSGLGPILGSLELPVGVIAANVVFSEPISFTQWFGIILILVAISLDQIKTWARGRRSVRVEL